MSSPVEGPAVSPFLRPRSPKELSVSGGVVIPDVTVTDFQALQPSAGSQTPASPTTPNRKRPGLTERKPSRARFAEDDQLVQSRTAEAIEPELEPSTPVSVTSETPVVPQNGDFPDLEKQPQDSDMAEQESASIWQGFKRYFRELKESVGPVEPKLDQWNMAVDAGIDGSKLEKLRRRFSHSPFHSPFHSRNNSITALQEKWRGSVPNSTFTSAVSSPGTLSPVTGSSSPRSRSYQDLLSSVDPKRLDKALKKLKEGKEETAAKATKKKEKEEKQRAKKYYADLADLNDRRTLCLEVTRGFMLFGAPSHRIEEYITQMFIKFKIDASIHYTVGCCQVCFKNQPDPKSADPLTNTSYTTLVRGTGLNVGAFKEVFAVYKRVVSKDTIPVEEALQMVRETLKNPPDYSPWTLVPVYGLASALASVWAYNGFWLDMIPSFFLGSIVGWLQVIVAARNPLYANVLEVSAALVTSFGARAFATIGAGGDVQQYFCFSAVANGSITMILPGYIVLCGALELQSRSITAGSTRLFYAIMYSLLLGYGFNVGSQILKEILPNAPTTTTCSRTVDPLFKILLVPSFLVAVAILIRSKYKQIPLQVLFGSAAYTVNFFVAGHSTTQVANTASAFVLGCLGHFYARSKRGFAFATVVAGIMILVPSGLSAQGGLAAGLNIPIANNGTINAQEEFNNNISATFSTGAQMIQVAIGLSVGLFLSAIFVYPLGRSNNAMFSF